MTKLGIELNLDNCEEVIKMEPPTTNKQAMKLNGMLTVRKIFIARSSHHAFSFYKLLNKEAHFEWTVEYKQVFMSLKKIQSIPPVLFKLVWAKFCSFTQQALRGRQCCPHPRDRFYLKVVVFYIQRLVQYSFDPSKRLKAQLVANLREKMTPGTRTSSCLSHVHRQVVK